VRYADAVQHYEYLRDPRIPDLVSLTEAAEILGITRQAVHLRALELPVLGALIGKSWVFRRSVVEAARATPDEA
jgi:hypothetical protein